ncbi:hypothetical protein HUW51_09145 [Adhaeribacter swui]|uniref:DUF4097 family beta strand repeat protein n=1 Tax=Adhaeribacter swui TaxID=2086471 RepID=A0A7G7G6V6_9BACT|nr:hypothetical protein [Adhaeribacter swui]QNF32890.1 hypothetical protein HUW51_09145 [Adhaeribacter swui]
MKKMLLSLAVLTYSGLTGNAFAQKLTENISRSVSFNTPTGTHVLYVQNIQGDVRVEGSTGDKVELTAEKTITAKTQADAEKGMREVQLKTEASGDTVYVYLEAPFIYRRKGRMRSMNVDKEEDYDFAFNIIVKVPRQTNLEVSTINDGEVTVANTQGTVKANNVNGPIKISNIEGTTRANTVNGNVDVTYTKNPTGDSDFRTINGKLNVVFKPNLSADFTFKTMHGEFYSDFDGLKTLPAQTVQNTKNKGTGTVYKVDSRQAMRLGKGGPTFSFETLNGNVYVRQGK